MLTAFLLALPAGAQEVPDNPQPFNEWLKDLRRDAHARGISQETIDAAFDGMEVDDRVLELDRKQPESTITLDEYLERTVNDKRIRKGREMMSEYRSLLREIAHKYGVQPRFIIALWGIETNYGRNSGGFSTIDALTTLAYDGRRADFFRDELMKALSILDSEHVLPGDLEGSWAGAMGQCQFMPTSFLQFAVDYNGDGHRDIWNTPADVFASIANYLSSSGWDGGESWGRKVILQGSDARDNDIKIMRSISEWKREGVRDGDGGELSPSAGQTSVILVGDDNYYMVTDNYKVLLKWNRSRFFATAVGTLADEIEE